MLGQGCLACCSLRSIACCRAGSKPGSRTCRYLRRQAHTRQDLDCRAHITQDAPHEAAGEGAEQRTDNKRHSLQQESAALHGKLAGKLLARSAACRCTHLLRCQPEAACSHAPLHTPPIPRQPHALRQPTIPTLADSLNSTQQYKPLHALDQHVRCLPSVFSPFCISDSANACRDILSLCCISGNCRHTRLHCCTHTSPVGLRGEHVCLTDG